VQHADVNLPTILQTVARLAILAAAASALGVGLASAARADAQSFLEVQPIFGGDPAKALHDAEVLCSFLTQGYQPGPLVQALTAVGGWPPGAARLLATAAVGHLCPAYKYEMAEYIASTPNAPA